MCKKCLAADFILNAACIYAAQNGLSEDDIFDALVMAVEGAGLADIAEEDDEDLENMVLVTHTIQ